MIILLFTRLPTPKGVPHELHTNLPDNARSALRLELPHTKHLFPIMGLNQLRVSSKNDNGALILLAYPNRLSEINSYKTSSFSFNSIVAPL